jgi:hypothetical protein
MTVATILRAADVNDARSYYHYTDELNFARDYYRNQPMLLFVVVQVAVEPRHMSFSTFSCWIKKRNR